MRKRKDYACQFYRIWDLGRHTQHSGLITICTPTSGLNLVIAEGRNAHPIPVAEKYRKDGIILKEEEISDSASTVIPSKFRLDELLRQLQNMYKGYDRKDVFAEEYGSFRVSLNQIPGVINDFQFLRTLLGYVGQQKEN